MLVSRTVLPNLKSSRVASVQKASLFEKMQTSMPADRPGQLSREQNADILAFLFRSNGFPAGEKELPTDAAVLQKIRFEAAKTK